MKVLLINGSPNEKGCTRRALNEIENTLVECGVEVEAFNIETDAVVGCLGCRVCREFGRKNGVPLPKTEYKPSTNFIR